MNPRKESTLTENTITLDYCVESIVVFLKLKKFSSIKKNFLL